MWNSAITTANALVLDRRKFLAISGGLIAAGVLPKNALALAGPYTFKQGAYDVTVVSDGTLLLPISMVFVDAPDEEVIPDIDDIATSKPSDEIDKEDAEKEEE